jgi:hypothetical protein
MHEGDTIEDVGEGHKEFPNEAPPRALTFADTVIVNTPLFLVLQERVISLNGGGPIDLCLSEGPLGDQEVTLEAVSH